MWEKTTHTINVSYSFWKRHLSYTRTSNDSSQSIRWTDISIQQAIMWLYEERMTSQVLFWKSSMNPSQNIDDCVGFLNQMYWDHMSEATKHSTYCSPGWMQQTDMSDISMCSGISNVFYYLVVHLIGPPEFKTVLMRMCWCQNSTHILLTDTQCFSHQSQK